MISLIMAGGRASRLGGIEKPLLRICGKVVIDVVIDVAKNFSRDVYWLYHLILGRLRNG